MVARNAKGPNTLENDNMKHLSTSFVLACVLCTSLGAPSMAQHAGEHIMLDPSELTWNDLPALPG
jgi:hypothetical protein